MEAFANCYQQTHSGWIYYVCPKVGENEEGIAIPVKSSTHHHAERSLAEHNANGRFRAALGSAMRTATGSPGPALSGCEALSLDTG